jgi:hypothetical protein
MLPMNGHDENFGQRPGVHKDTGRITRRKSTIYQSLGSTSNTDITNMQKRTAAKKRSSHYDGTILQMEST